MTIAQQNFDMNAFLNKEIDAASAMTYNEMAQVFETTDADGKLVYTLDDLNILDFNAEGTAMLEDLIFTNADWLASRATRKSPSSSCAPPSGAGFTAVTTRMNAWAIVLEAGPTLGKGHQEWQMNEINKLIWPSPDGIGITDADAFATTAQIALDYTMTMATDHQRCLTAKASSYRNDLAQAALDSLQADMSDPRREGRGLDSADRRNHPQRRVITDHYVI